MTEFNDLYQTDPARLARPDVQALTPYQSARRIAAAAGIHGDVWLNANESSDADAMAPLKAFLTVTPNPSPKLSLKPMRPTQALTKIRFWLRVAVTKGLNSLCVRSAILAKTQFCNFLRPTACIASPRKPTAPKSSTS